MNDTMACGPTNILWGTGEFERGRLHGLGSVHSAGGLAYYGEWRNGRRHGGGVEFVALGGETIECSARYLGGVALDRVRCALNACICFLYGCVFCILLRLSAWLGVAVLESQTGQSAMQSWHYVPRC